MEPLRDRSATSWRKSREMATRDENYELGSLILRVYNLNDISSERANGRNYFDIMVNNETGDLFINTKWANKSYYVELGLKTLGGLFMVMARSNVLNMPKVGVSGLQDAKDYERLFRLLGIDNVDINSEKAIKAIRDKFNELMSINSSPVKRI